MSTPTSHTPARRVVSAAQRYGSAVLSVAVAFILTFLLRTDGLVAPIFFLAIIVSAWIGGIGPGLLAALLATLSIAYFFLPPIYSLSFDPVHLPQLLVFFVSAALVSSWSVARKRAEALLRQARDEQEAKVQERTADLKQANEKLQAEIAERRRVEETLRERASLLDLTHDTVSARGMDDVITYWNRGAEEQYGWTSEEAVGQTSHDLLRTIFPAPLEEINEELLRTGRWEGELVHTRRDEAQIAVASRWALRRDESGRPVAILETNNDITERRRAEEALRESEEQWRAVFENNPTMYFMVDADGTILSVNPFGAEQLGYTVGELVGSPVLDVFYEPDREAVRRNVARCFDQLNRPMSWEARKVHKDGKVLCVRETARAVLLKNRPVVLVACEDITERKRAEEQLEETEQRLRAVIANAPVILFALDSSGVFTLSEGRGLDALGRRPGDVVGQSVSDIYRDAPQVLSGVRRALAGESLTEVVEANDLVFETHYIPVLDEGGQVGGVNGVAINITERKRAEEALRERASLLDLTHDTVFVRGMDDVITYWNRGAEERYGWTSEEAVGQVSHRLTQTIFPAPLEEINKQLLDTGRWEGELIHAKRDGSRVVVASRWSLQRDEQGNPVAILETNNDITERKRAEEALQKAQAELAHVTRVTTMGELASSIAHEVNQPLAAIVTNANAALRWLAGQPPNLDEARETVGRIARDGHRASEVIGRVRALFRKAAPARERLDINDLIQDVIDLVPGEVRRNRILLRTELAPDLPPVLGDRVQLQQVLLNLMINGIEAMSTVTDRSRDLLVRTRRDESGKVIVSVRDSGVGINPQNTDQLFDAFYTTKPEGMGMGLSVSRSIIEAHGGSLWAASDGGPGATFQFTLPVDEGKRHD